MPIRKTPGTHTEYALIVYDEDGRECREPDGSLLSATVISRVSDKAAPITDIFLISHGWKGDVPAAIEQYDKWIDCMSAQQADLASVKEVRPGFSPLIVGLHWPSLPWGDENIPPGTATVLSADEGATDPVGRQVETYAARIADSPKAREALRTIFLAAHAASSAALPLQAKKAYEALFQESGLANGGVQNAPGQDQDGFDPEAIIKEAAAAAVPSVITERPGVLGVAEDAKDLLLMPLRQLSFWKMKDRARRFGESGAHNLLAKLQAASPGSRLHLMGHSFGCIVAAATVLGPQPPTDGLLLPVDSLFLVQGALSLWSFSSDIPYAKGQSGYFQKILGGAMVRGALITTRSTHDTAVGRFYPLGAELKGQFLLDEVYPKYGGIGAFGVQGISGTTDLPMKAANAAYDFRLAGIYNLEASQVIKIGGGASGAHSDIAHPEVAHAFWSGVLAPMRSTATGSVLGGAPAARGSGGARQSSADRPHVIDKPPLGRVRGKPPLSDLDLQVRQLRDDGESSQGAAPPFRAGGDVLLSVESDAAVVFGSASPAERPPPPEGRPSPVAATRYLTAEFEGHERTEPLVVNRWYTLAFDVDVVERAAALAHTALREELLWPSGVESIVLTVQLDSTDFEISDSTRPLRLSRTGRSLTKARFDLSPKHNGATSLRATVHKDGNFIQQMDLSLTVGAGSSAAVQIESRGRPKLAVGTVKPRDIGISISPGVGGYDCTVFGAVAARARLPITAAGLGAAVEAARNEILKVVMMQNAAGRYVFQADIDISEKESQDALEILARAGALLFRNIFYSAGAGPDSQHIGDFLRQQHAANPDVVLKLQIVAETAPIPWGLLYLGDASRGAALDWSNFIGLRHIIEQIPLQNSLTVTDSTIFSNRPRLSISTNVNSLIDPTMRSTFVADQLAYWKKTAEVRRPMIVTSRDSSIAVVDALRNKSTDDQIFYCYCHAKAGGLTDPGGPDASSLVFDKTSITLGDLKLDAGEGDVTLRGNPLVFINACESAEMSPTFYDGFVPYFMSIGARGVIGTECKTPARFAAVWAERFFEKFLDGVPLGELFLALRQEFVKQSNNPLGLLYAVHCDGDTLIDPALIVASTPAPGR